MIRWSVAGALLVSTLVLAQEKVQLNRVTRVTVTADAVEITGSRQPSFTTFTMSDPARLVVDVADAVFVGVPEVIEGQGAITGVKTASYGSTSTSIARVLIGFDRNVETDIEAKGNTLIVRLLRGRGEPVAQAKPEAPPEETAEVPTHAQQQQAARDAARKAEDERKAQAQAAREAAQRAEAERKAQQDAAREAARKAEADRKAQAEEARKAQQEAARAAREERARQVEAEKEAARKAAEDKRRQEEAQRAAEKQRAEETARRQAEEKTAAEAQRKAEVEAQRRAEEDRLRQEKEAKEAARRAEEERARKADEQRKAELAAKKAADEERRRQQAEAEEAARRAEADRQRQGEERRRQEAEAKEAARRAEEDRVRQQQEARRAELEAKKAAEEERKRQEQAARKAELEAKRTAEAERRRQQAEARAAERRPAPTPAAGRNTVSLVGFRPHGNGARVFVRTEQPAEYRIREADARTVIVTLEHTRIGSSNNSRALDTSFFGTPVIGVYPVEAGGEVRVEIKLRDQVPYQARQEGPELVLEFEGQ